MTYSDEWFTSIYGPRPSTKNRCDLEQELQEAYSSYRSSDPKRMMRYERLQDEEERLTIWESQRDAAMAAFRKAEQDTTAAFDRSSYITEIRQQLSHIVPEYAHDSALFMTREAVRRFMSQAARIYQLEAMVTLLQQSEQQLEDAAESSLRIINGGG